MNGLTIGDTRILLFHNSSSSCSVELFWISFLSDCSTCQLNLLMSGFYISLLICLLAPRTNAKDPGMSDRPQRSLVFLSYCSVTSGFVP